MPEEAPLEKNGPFDADQLRGRPEMSSAFFDHFKTPCSSIPHLFKIPPYLILCFPLKFGDKGSFTYDVISRGGMGFPNAYGGGGGGVVGR